MMIPILLLTLVILLSFTCFLLVTKLQQSKSKILQLERAASLGTFINTVLQEVEKPLSFIQSQLSELREYAGYLQEVVVRLRTSTQLSHDEEKQLERIHGKESLEDVMAGLDTKLDQLEEAVNTSKKTLKEVKILAIDDLKKADPIHLGDVLERVLLYQSPQMEGKILIHRDYTTLPPLVLPAGLLFQLLRILIESNIDAMIDGGHLQLSLKFESNRAVIGIQGDEAVQFSPKKWQMVQDILKEMEGRLIHTTPKEANLFQIQLPPYEAV